jgi:hypothetical protein
MSAGGKGGRRIELTTLPPTCAHRLEILVASTSWGPKGLSGPVCISLLPVQYTHEVRTNGLGFWPTNDFGISGVEPSGSACSDLITSFWTAQNVFQFWDQTHSTYDTLKPRDPMFLRIRGTLNSRNAATIRLRIFCPAFRLFYVGVELGRVRRTHT